MQRIHLLSMLLLCALWPFNCHSTQIYERQIAAANEQRNNSLKDKRLTSAPARSIHLGYVYDDADDVIHIIEPPQHFEELKRRQKQQQQQQQQVVPLVLPKKAAIMKVKELPHIAPSPVINSRRHRRKPPSRDLLTQQTQAAQSRAEDVQLPLVVKFPMEILASVRQTERILQQRQQQQRPHAKQRIKTQQTHTVITEQGYAKSHFKRGNEQRVGGLYASSKAVKRVRRNLKNDTETTPQQAALKSAPQTNLHDTNIEQGAELLLRLSALLKNATLYLPDDNEQTVNVIATPQNSVLQELRTRFQQQSGPKKLIGEIEPFSSDYNSNHRQQPATFVEHDILQILENSLNATDALMQQIMRKNLNNKIDLKCNHQTLYEVGDSLQQYQSKIDCMRQQLEAVQRNSVLPPLPTKVLTTVNSTAASATTTTLSSSTTARGHRRFGARSAYKYSPTGTTTTTSVPATTTITTTATNITPISQNHNLVAAIRQRQRFNKKSTGLLPNSNRIEPHSSIFKTKARKSATQLLDARNVSAAAAALLYDDVMTNIRNMLEAKHLKLLVSKPETASTANSADEAFTFDDFSEASSSSSSPITAVQAENHFRDLNFYLSGLQQMMSRFPHLTSTSIVPHELAHARNGDVDGGNGALDTSTDWYLINDDGKISETSYNLGLQPSAVVFHRFPDIPNAAFYLQNHATHRSTTAGNNDESDFDFS